MKPIYTVTLLAVLLASLSALQATESPAALANPERMPAFSWDHVPLYVHIRKDTAFTDEEIKYLATFPLITFEKATGHTDSGSVEAGTLKAARAVKAINPATKMRKMLGPRKLMLANILRARFPDSGLRYINALDGSYIEGFQGAVAMSKKDYVAQGMEAFQKAAQQGSIIGFTCGLGNNQQDADETPRAAARNRNSNAVKRDAKSRFDYQLAIFLICAEKYSYFDLKDSYDAKTSKTWMTHPADYDRPLGEPKGPALRDGYTYTREFAHASVQLDIENETAKIVWK